MDRGAWWAAVHGIFKSQTRLSSHILVKCNSVDFLEHGPAQHHPACPRLSPHCLVTILTDVSISESAMRVSEINSALIKRQA